MKKVFQIVLFNKIIVLRRGNCGNTVFHSYQYDTVIQVFQNDSVNIASCVDPLKTLEVPEIQIEPSLKDNKGKTLGYLLG